ncbi:MAG TPA: hypothetical protein VFQ91_23050 [Bryobacteraceae bacterium]|nr:hypothetical protein [Bryobacteraceae bacterium]
MNLKDYYREIDEQLAQIPDAFVLVASLATPNGGKAGVVSEVSRRTAATLVVEKKARMLTPAETEQWQAERDQRQKQKDIAALQERMRMSRLAEDELRALRAALQTPRKGE